MQGLWVGRKLKCWRGNVEVLRIAKTAVLRLTTQSEEYVLKPEAPKPGLNRHRPNFFFHFDRVDHHNGIPGAPVQEAPIRPLAQALLATNAKNRIHLNPSERRMILIRHPEHAVFHRTVLHARRRPRASRAALRDHRQFFGFLLSRGGEPFGLRFKLKLVRNHPDGLGSSPRCGRHDARDYSPKPKPKDAENYFGCPILNVAWGATFRAGFSAVETGQSNHCQAENSGADPASKHPYRHWYTMAPPLKRVALHSLLMLVLFVFLALVTPFPVLFLALMLEFVIIDIGFVSLFEPT